MHKLRSQTNQIIPEILGHRHGVALPAMRHRGMTTSHHKKHIRQVMADGQPRTADQVQGILLATFSKVPSARAIAGILRTSREYEQAGTTRTIQGSNTGAKAATYRAKFIY